MSVASSVSSSGAHSRQVFSTYVLEAQRMALLDWLDPAFEEGKHYGRASHSYFFMGYYDG
jgi:hypothetical protein